MFDNKFLITLLGLIVAVVAINNIKSKEDDEIKEDFNMFPMTWKVGRVAGIPAKPGTPQKGQFFSVPGSYQAMLNPRFSNVDYGANIRYNMPSYENRAAPCDPLGYASNPLTFASMVNNANAKENYKPDINQGATVRENYGSTTCASGSCVPDCRKGGAPASFHGGAPLTEPAYADGDFNKVTESVYSDPKFNLYGNTSLEDRSSNYCSGGKENGQVSLSSMLPVRDMTTINIDGDIVQPIVYDNYMFAPKKSRLARLGDPVRGDLAIAPCNTGWFQVSVQPNIDLQRGALNVLAGINNEQGKSLADLVYKTSGNAETAIGGVDMSKHVNMSTMFGGGLTAGNTDVHVTAFP